MDEQDQAGRPERASQKYAPSNLAPDPAEQMRHETAGGRIAVQESSGVAAAEATGKISAPNEGDPEETAGSG